MPRAKKHMNYRYLTKAGRMSQKRKPDAGRPKGTYKRFRFEQTRLGFFLRYEAPVVYALIREMTPPGYFFEPPYLLIKILCAASGDPVFRKAKFHRYLEEYLDNGLFCRTPKKPTPTRVAYYERLRTARMKRYIEQNRDKIERYRQQSGGDPQDDTGLQLLSQRTYRYLLDSSIIK